MVQITVDDLVVSYTHARDLREYLDDTRNRSFNNSVELSTKGVSFTDIPESVRYVVTTEQMERYTQWLTKSHIHSEYLLAHPELFLDQLNGVTSSTVVKHSGVKTTWVAGENIDFLRVKPDAIDRVLSPWFTRIPDEQNYHLWYTFNEPKMQDTYIGDAQTSITNRALWLAKRSSLMQVLLSGNGVSSEHRTGIGTALFVKGNTSQLFSVKLIRDLMLNTARINDLKVNPNTLANYRREVFTIQQAELRKEENLRRQIAQQNFRTYWDNIKTRQRSNQPDEGLAAEQWATIPLVDVGTKTSRTWGIEVETVRAHQTSRPAGWSDVYDGSLDSDGCDCDCDDCYNGEHCEDSDSLCSNGESREFVSPVLDSFNSNGLRKLCHDLGDYESNTTPGIHVHVGADNLTVMDVARLLFAYGVVAPLITPLYHREAFGYCKEMGSDNVQWWMSAVKSYLRTSGHIPTPRDICHDQPTDRYNDVNLYSLSKHGTIEFRAMGPFYNYDHLVRWAWFVREMVNVSRLGLDQSVWTSCKSIADVITVLRKYGQELPPTKETISVSTSELMLTEN